MPNSFLQLVKQPVKFNLFLLYKLPSAFFCGVRVKSINESICIVTVPYKWLSQNPFKSTYFACLAMAAEMSTGLLAMQHTHKSVPSVSMLVTQLEANYFKKAIGKTYFTCEDGPAFVSIIGQCKSSGESKTLKSKSIGRNAAGEIIAEFYLTWSFKSR